MRLLLHRLVVGSLLAASTGVRMAPSAGEPSLRPVDPLPATSVPGQAARKLETKVAPREAGSGQAARRDQELATAIDDLREHTDAQERAGPGLPSQLKELFLASGTNESPLSINGQFLFSYSQFNGK